MKVKAVLLEIMWYFARVLVYLKRSFVFIFKIIGKVWSIGHRWYKETVGFIFFKSGFYLKRRLFPESKHANTSLWYWMGERWILQLGAVLVAFFFVIPQTKLYKPDFGEVPGKKALLYNLVGPGEQDFSLADDLITETIATDTSGQSEAWRAGTVGIQPQAIDDIRWETEYNTTLNGAIVKPAYVPANTNVPTKSNNQNRITITQYTVKQGDVIGGIASRNGVSVQTLLLANKMTVRSLIRPGDILRIPSADGVLHTIAKNETVSKIAKLYGVAVDDILKANNIQQSALKVGQEILVPGATKLPTQVATTPKNTNNKPTPVKLTPKNTQPSQSGVSTAGYIWPSGARIITQYYGLRHTGVDIAGPIGLPNYAARSGTVIKSQCGYNGGYGCYIILDHGDGVQTLYGHNSQLLVSPGEYVLQGQVIGLLGSTGRSTGPHLHFEVRVNGHRANPLQFIRR
jgi:murein DD-endopeptidase MepM/ murein hydrolase activator NlpD